jgi:hypothetical protein
VTKELGGAEIREDREHNIWDKGDWPIINCLPMTEHLFISSSYVLHFE